MNTYQNYINRLKNRYRLRRVAESLLIAVGIVLLVHALSRHFFTDQTYAWITGILAGAGLFIGRYLHLQLHRLQEQHITIYLDRHLEELEHSTDLLLVEQQTLRPLQQLQRRKLLSAFENATRNIQWPQQWRSAILVLVLGLIASWLSSRWGNPNTGKLATFPAVVDQVISSDDSASVPAELEDYRITVDPPAYTGRRRSNTTDFNLKVPEGSRINWELTFSGSPEPVMLIFSNGDSLQLTRKDRIFRLSIMANRSGFYSISWRDRDLVKNSDFYKLEIVEDQPPQPAITNQEQFVEFPWQEEIEVTVRSSIRDDYGLTEAYVIATVSKGSGESVKFREERLSFNRPKEFSGKSVEATLALNTRQLGMEPGDELYYYVEAWDNHTPQRQSNRTETYFIQIRDTATQMISFEGGLGVDLMPEYFRSQRQIIIDSEKLLAEKKSIDKPEFDTRSNDLAHDQKVLRLRYGQFLGEEFESEAVPEETTEAETPPENEEEVLEKYGHAHDTDNEHNLVEEHDHEHEEDPNPEKQEESPLEAFVHSHDNMEEATFFVKTVKAKLRAALSMMWDAELHLRMSDPAQSLPYQYKILQLLKEIAQDSRIYVHRTGFDAPPLKEDKRLSGDLDEVASASDRYTKADHESYPAVRQALPLVDQCLQKPPTTLTGAQRETLLAAGNELAGAAIEQPDLYLEPLTVLRSLMDGNVDIYRLRTVRAAFYRLLPLEARSVGDQRNGAHALQDVFIQQLKARSYR